VEYPEQMFEDNPILQQHYMKWLLSTIESALLWLQVLDSFHCSNQWSFTWKKKPYNYQQYLTCCLLFVVDIADAGTLLTFGWGLYGQVSFLYS
jgi:hypothetical protein